MQLFTYRPILASIIVFLLSFSSIWGQTRPEDCEGAIIICSDEVINFNPNGFGKDDFANPNNFEGCLIEKEQEGLWFFFSFRTDMPLNSIIEFTITPLGDLDEDYDFAIYGPDLTCDSLGSPVRCSFFDQICTSGPPFFMSYRCPETGLGRAATDTSETRFDNDGFVAPMLVQPGEGFYMYLDNFGRTTRAFQLEWGGSAAPFLNCLADPVCNNKKLDAGEDVFLCASDVSYQLQATMQNVSPAATVRWSAEPAEAVEFLNDSTILNPVVNIPLGFTDPIVYAITLSDEGCERIDYVKVNANRPDITIEGENPFCSGDPNILTAPEGFVKYLWSTLETTRSIEVFDPGTYLVEVTDSLGCVARGEIIVDVFAPRLFKLEGPDTVCLNETANLRATPGFETYSWSTGENSIDNIFTSGSGMYSVIVTDENNCVYTDSLFLNEWESPEPSFSGDVNFCNGQTGLIIAESGYQKYQWSTGDTTETITVNEGGIYSVIVTNDNLCTGVGSVEVTRSDLPRPIITGAFNICSGSSTELDVGNSFERTLWSTLETTTSIIVNSGGQYWVEVMDSRGCLGFDTVRVTENTLPDLQADAERGFCPGDSVVLDPGNFIKYEWSTGDTAPTITVNSRGDYGVTVTDVNNCETADTFQVEPYNSPVFNLSDDFTFCQNDSVQISVQQDFPIYRWSDGREGKSVFFDRAGTYSVTVTNENGCSSEQSFDVSLDTLPDVQIEGVPSICENGVVQLQGPPGFATYSWSTGESDENININSAGSYSLSVTDANGCLGQDSVEITEQAAPVPSFSGLTGFCPGDTTQIRVIGGYQSYRWSNGDTSVQSSFFEAGTYSVTVTDAFGCEGVSSIDVNTFTLPEPKITGKTAFCEGYTSVLQVSRNYASYRWSNGDDKYLTVINEGMLYKVTVEDDNGCPGSDSILVKVNPRPMLTIEGALNICEGGQTELDAGPGFSAYIWSTGNDSTQTQIITEPGYYSVVVRDTNNCLIANGVTVSKNENPDPTIDGESLICEDGQTTLTAQSGYIKYEWSNNPSNNTNTNLITANSLAADGIYGLTVTDSNNCRGDTIFQVEIQNLPDPNLIGNLGFCQGDSTELLVEQTFDSYLWSTGDTSNNATFDQPGNYGLTVTDALGCRESISFEVEEYSLPVVDLSSEIKVCPDVTAVIDGGEGFARYEWSNDSAGRFLYTDTLGEYTLTLTDNNGCMNSGSTTLTPFDKPEISLPEDMVFCPGASTSIEADSGFVFYIWSDSTRGQTITVTEPGVYILTVQDTNGCEATDTIAFMAFPTVKPEIMAPDSTCADANNLLQAPDDFSSYKWSAGDVLLPDTDHQVRISGGGTFSVTATDENGCVTSDTVQIISLPNPIFNFTGDKALCEGVPARVAIEPNSFFIEWWDGSSDSVRIFPQSGNYPVTVTDAYGCRSSDSIELLERDAPEADAGPDLELPCAAVSVQIGSDQNPDGSQFQYNWAGPGINSDNRNLMRPQVDSAGKYFFKITDTLSGCQSPIRDMEVFGGAADYDVSIVIGDNVDCVTGLVELDARRTEKADSLILQWLDPNKTPIADATGLTVNARISDWYFLESKLIGTRCTRLDSIQVRPDFLAPIAVAGPDQSLTCEKRAISLDASASSQGVGIRYEWRSGNGPIGTDPQIVVREAGTYFLKVSNVNNGCSSLDTIEINMNQEIPSALLAGDLELDCLSPSGILDGSASSNGPNIVYSWFSDPPTNNISERSNRLTVNQAGRYGLIVSNKLNACADTVYAQVVDNISEVKIIDLSVRAPKCFNTEPSDGLIRVESVEGGTPPYIYSFDGKPFTSNPEAAKLRGGTHTVIVEDAIGCRAEETVELSSGNFIQVRLEGDKRVGFGEQVRIDADVQAGRPLASFQWLTEPFDSTSSRTIIETIDKYPPKQKEYIAQAIDVDGCTDLDTIIVEIFDTRNIYIPNVFYPNGKEALNRRFTVFASSLVTEIKSLMVFDRWGNQVFERYNFAPNDPSLGWDGKLRNKDVQAGVFAYFCEVVFPDGKKRLYTGDVTLIR